MNYVIKIKTGFYETKLCQFSILKDCIKILPYHDDSKDYMIFSSSYLVSLQLTKGKHSEIEIKTRDQTLSGVFEENQDLKEIYEKLKENINTKITYEEE